MLKKISRLQWTISASLWNSDYRCKSIRKDLLELHKSKISSSFIRHFLNVSGKLPSRHVNKDRVASCLVKIQEVAASIRCLCNHTQELYFWPEHLFEVQHNLILNSHSKVLDGFFLPVWKFWFKHYGLRFQHAKRNGNNSSIGHKCSSIFHCYLYSIIMPHYFCHPKK